MFSRLFGVLVAVAVIEVCMVVLWKFPTSPSGRGGAPTSPPPSPSSPVHIDPPLPQLPNELRQR